MLNFRIVFICLQIAASEAIISCHRCGCQNETELLHLETMSRELQTSISCTGLCADEFDVGLQLECPEYQYLCKKYFNHNTKVTSRNCAQTVDLQSFTEKKRKVPECHSVKILGTYTEECLCKADLCNKGSSFKKTSSLIPFRFTGFLLLYFWNMIL